MFRCRGPSPHGPRWPSSFPRLSARAAARARRPSSAAHAAAPGPCGARRRSPQLPLQRLLTGNRQLAALDARARAAAAPAATSRAPARRSRSTCTTRGWKKRILRTRSRLMRLAVRFAMQPDANRRRAFAMSTRGVSTGTPTASIARPRRVDDRQDHVEVVDHQVEDDVDVEAPLRERAEAMDLDEPRHVRSGRAADRRIEPLGVPTASITPRARAGDQASASATDRAIGFSTSTATRAREAAARRRGAPRSAPQS